MNSPSTVMLIATVLAAIVNTFAVLGIAWRGGRYVGQMAEAQRNIARSLELLREDFRRVMESHDDRIRALETGRA